MGRLGRCRLLGLPILIELVGQPAKGRSAAHGSGLAAIFAHLLVTQQQTERTAGQRPLHLPLALVSAFVEPAFASPQQLFQHLFHGVTPAAMFPSIEQDSDPAPLNRG